MKRLLFLLLGTAFSLSVLAQNTKIQLTKAVKAGRQDGFDIYQVQFKVLSGEVQNRSEFVLLKSGMISNYIKAEVYDKYSSGQTTKSDEALYVAGAPIAAGQTLVSYDLATPLPPKRTFSFKTETAFLGDAPKEFFTTISGLKGTLKVGDEFDYQNNRGQRGKGKIKEITVGKTLHPPVLIEGLPEQITASLLIQSDNGVDFSKATAASAGSLAGASATTAGTDKPAANVTGKTKTIPVNAVLQNDEVKITVHNLIKYNPDAATSQNDMVKIDYSLDYYIVDATVENISSHDIDPGEYLVRLNFFSPDGKSADEYLRLFKKQNGDKDEAKSQADAIDKLVLGGTSKIKSAGVLVRYQEMIPDYQEVHKPVVDALYRKMAPGRKLHSIAATILAVPPAYKIEGLGTWKGTFFSKKNLSFIKL